MALGAIGMTMIIVERRDRSLGRIGHRADRRGDGARVARRHGASWRSSSACSPGASIGIVNGLAITRLKVIPFIATLGMLGVARGVAKWVADQQTVNIPETWINELAVTFPRPDG